ncbi:MAG TPA: phage holin family protein [Longimicrobiaceae bacterium]|nr:phage holin family protein [Longimicrobiaceae bacterium]
MRLLLRWIVSAAAVAAAAYLVRGIQVQGGATALLAVALILGLVNALVRPLVRRLACGLIFLTLGLFIFIINALMLLLTAWIARSLGVGFAVESFTAALLGAVVISVVSFLLSFLLPDQQRRRR